MLRSKRFRLAVRLIGIALAVCLLGLGGLWLAMPAISQFMAERSLMEYGIEVGELDVEGISLGQMNLGRVRLQSDLWQLDMENGQVRYDAHELLSDGRLKSLDLNGFEVTLLPGLLGILEVDEEADSEMSVNFSSVDQIPVRRILVNKGSLNLRFGNVPQIKWNADLRLEQEVERALDLEARSESAAASLTVRSVEDRGLQLESDIEIVDTLGLLGQVMPDWREVLAIPEELKLEMGQLAVSSLATGVSAEEWEAKTLVELAELDLAYDTGILELEQVAVEIMATGEGGARGSFTAFVKECIWEDFRLRSDALLALDFDYRENGNLELKSREAISWSYDAEALKGEANIELQIALGDSLESIRYEGTVRESSLSLAGHGFESFDVQVSGDLEVLEFSVEKLVSKMDPVFQLADISGDYTLDLGDGSSALELSARVVADALGAWAESIDHPSIDLELESLSSEESSEIMVTLNPDSVSHRFEVAGIEFNGPYTLVLNGSDEGLNDVWDFSATLDSQASFVRSEAMAVDGLVLEVAGSMQGVDIAAIEESASSGARSLIQKARFDAEWQANEIKGLDVSAKWSGGSLVFDPRGEERNLQLTAGSGVLTVGDESIQQVYVAAESVASLESIDTRAKVSFLLQGQSGQLEVAQTVSSLLSNPVVNGEFRLAPLVFEYSDLLGRVEEELQGVSFSGTLESSGSYSANRSGVRAEVDTRFRDGSVDAPGHQAQANGINAQFFWDELDFRNPIPSRGRLSIAGVSVGDLEARNLQLEAELKSPEQIEIVSAQVEAYGGGIFLKSSTLSIEPFSYVGSIAFDRLSLDDITSEMEFFRGEMTGRISGELPMRYAGGKLLLEEGYLSLPSGETALLRYNASDIFRSEASDEASGKKRLGDLLLEKLEIDPEGFVEDALANLSISDLQVQLFSRETPLTPIRIEFSGEATSGATKVPLHLQTNVNGTLEELFNFLLRLNSL
ncbi:MAG: YdbH domain-containing protein [Verrucomicrobiota bacterium]